MSDDALDPASFASFLELALDEDRAREDVTAAALLEGDGPVRTAEVVAREDGVVAGLALLEPLFRLLDPAAREWALNEVATSLNEVGAAVRGRCPRARVMFVDYLTLLPPAGIPAPPLSEPIADLARHVAARLEDLTATAARETGCEIVAASHASRDHHAWSGAPWTIGAGPFLPGRPKPFHPNAEGMSAVADLVVARVGGRGTGEGDGH